jgi:HPt (histidine-containing phosphotransfer) domain-containing protein
MLPENGGTTRKDADPVLDEKSLSDLAAVIGKDRLRVVLIAARAECAQLRKNLNAAAAEENDSLIRRTAHALVGTCAQIGAVEVGALASFIEKKAKSLSEIQALRLDLDAALDLLDADIAAYVSRHYT